MITKRDWKKFVQKVYKIHVALGDVFDMSRSTFTINGEQVIRVDLEKMEIFCGTDDFNTRRKYSHPESFKGTDPDFQRLKGAFRLELDVVGLDSINKIVRTR